MNNEIELLMTKIVEEVLPSLDWDEPNEVRVGDIDIGPCFRNVFDVSRDKPNPARTRLINKRLKKLGSDLRVRYDQEFGYQIDGEGIDVEKLARALGVGDEFTRMLVERFDA